MCCENEHIPECMAYLCTLDAQGKEPKMMRTAEPGLLRSSWFLKGGHWNKIEDHVDPSSNDTRRIIHEYVERGVFQFHTRHVALAAGSRQAVSSVPFSDGYSLLRGLFLEDVAPQPLVALIFPRLLLTNLTLYSMSRWGGSGRAKIWWI